MTHTPDSKAGAENAIAAHLDRTTEHMMLLADELAKLRAVPADNEIRVLEITERIFVLTERASARLALGISVAIGLLCTMPAIIDHAMTWGLG